MANINTKIILKNHPVRKVLVDDFQIVNCPIEEPGDREVLIKTDWLSIDPYVKGRISQTKSYANNVMIGEVITGESICTVIKSNSSRFKTGDSVIAMTGWQTHAVLPESKLHALPDCSLPKSLFLGIAGMPGITAWIGVTKICLPKPGELFVINAATGAVGSAAGQLAKKMGCRVVGIASTEEKCKYAVNQLGFDQCISHQDPNLISKLLQLTTTGIDCYFDNVGGNLFDLILPQMSIHGRVVTCGLIGEEDFQLTHPIQLRQILNKRIKIQAFIAYDYLDEWKLIQNELISLIKNKQLVYRESITKGIENAPTAFVEMLNGKNFGKQLICI